MMTLLFGFPAVLCKGRYSQEGRIYAFLATLTLDILIFYYV